MRSERLRRLAQQYHRFETRVFGLASEVEYRLKLTPRTTRIQPSAFDRRVLRLFVVLMPTLIAALFIGSRGLRIRITFAILVIVCVVLALFLLLDAVPGIGRKGGTGRKKGRRPGRP